MDLLSRLRLHLGSADPGKVALRVGLRVMSTFGAVCLVLLIVGRWVPIHPPSYVLAMITAIQGAAIINDKTAAARALTRVYAAFFGFIVIAGIALAGKSLITIDALLLVVVFLAAYAPRFGPRWQSVGMLAFMCGVVGSFLDAPVSDLVEIGCVLVLSGVVAQLVHDYVLPDRPAGDFRRAVAATVSLSSQLRQIVGAAEATPQHRHDKDAATVARLLSRDIRMCQNYLPMQVEGPGAGPNSAVTLRLLDLQLAAETVLDQESTSSIHDPELRRTRVEQQLRGLEAAEERLQAAVAELPAAFPEGQAPASPPPKPHRTVGDWLKDEQLRLAIQATLACALAIIGGRLISSDRWFWAVMTAFLIFMNTKSAGAVAVRGMSRAMGTLAGIVLGIGLATLLKGDLYLSLPLVAIAVFGAFYLVRVSYAAMNVCINVAIALIYGLVGIFTPELLVLRLEETAIGAAAGVFCALAILPVRTTQTAGQAMTRLLESMRTLIEAIIEAGGDQPTKNLTAAAAAVDAAFSGVVGANAPLRSVWTFGLAEAYANISLRRAYLLAHAAHVLEYSLREGKPAEPELQELRSIHDRLGAVVEKSVAADRPDATAEGRLAERQVEAEIADEPVRYAIEVISEILRQIEAEGPSR